MDAKKLLVDGDIIVYRAAFAAEKAFYRLHYLGSAEKTFSTKKELDAYVDAKSLDDFTIEKSRVLEPLENSLGNAKECLEKIRTTMESDDMRIFLTGKGNYRRQIPSYKAQRDPSMKPYWMEEVMAYMVKYWNAEIVEGMEADDAIGINHKPNARGKDETVIVSIDKDLDTLPGWHYNWVKQEIYEVSANEANRNFWIQMLVGDRADNIVGVPGVGPIKAAQLLVNCRNDNERRQVVTQEYELAYVQDAANQFSINFWLLCICDSDITYGKAKQFLGEISGKDTKGQSSVQGEASGAEDNKEATDERTGTDGASSGGSTTLGMESV